MRSVGSPLRYRREADYAEHFRALLDQAVGRSLIDSGEHIGIMLSGGMDSGPVAALAQRSPERLGAGPDRLFLVLARLAERR